MITTPWQKCVERLRDEISPDEYNILIPPLQAELYKDKLVLLAPNTYILEEIQKKFINKIHQIVNEISYESPITVVLEVGSSKAQQELSVEKIQATTPKKNNTNDLHRPHPLFTFDNFVIGKSNHMAWAGATQVSEHPGTAYNPLYIYGGVGLGKTHLMHAIGNKILQDKPDAAVLYLPAEGFVTGMVKALQRNTMEEFKRYCRSANALLIDDIQFFSGKERSQEEFFHTFNALFDAQQQIVLTCDRYHKEISGMEERLKSRFGWGLEVGVEPPDFETRTAIIMRKAEQSNVKLPDEVAFFIAKRIPSNVRELEGALKRVIANSQFTGQPITLEFTNEALRDLLAVQARLVSIENILKTVAEYYKIKVADLLSQRRSRFLARSRQVAMALAKELTNHSLPEIGEAFGGRDHTTVLHACRKIKELLKEDVGIREAYTKLLRILST